MGQVQGAKVFWQSGYSEDITTTEREVWSGSGAFHFADTASTLSVVSTDIGDTQSITISGLDANWAEIDETIVLNGVTPVVTTKSFIRVNSAYNISAADLVGTVTGSIGADVCFHIDPTIQKSAQSVYSVADGWTGYLFQGNAATDKADGVDFKFKVRQFGGRFIVEEHFGLFQNIYDTMRPFIPIPAKSDIVVAGKATTGNSPVTAQFGLLLMKDSIWKND